MKSIYDELRQMTRDLMDLRGWNQSDLADKLGVLQQSVSTWLKSEGHVGTLSPVVLQRLVIELRKQKIMAPKLESDKCTK